MTIHVVAAYQAPTLFNILATSKSWDLRMAPLGDHDDLAELAELTVPTWDAETDSSPEVVLVCSPAQFVEAKERWPDAKCLWVVHNGYERWLLPAEYEEEVDGAICFSEKNRWLQQTGRKARFFFVSPAYVADPVWSWAPDKLWTLRNRPASRRDDVDIVLAAITDGLPYECYGQEQTLGVADAGRKQELRRSCSAYVSAIQRTAGFGLAEHEAMAAGVPVIGSDWGDTELELPGYFSHGLSSMRRAAQRLVKFNALDTYAHELSIWGLNYIQRYRTARRMDESVATLLSAIG